MDKFRITGGTPLEGTIPVSGSKNAALPVLAACLLTDEPVVLHGVPHVRDLKTMEALLRHTGATTKRRENDALVVHAKTIESPEAPYEIVKTMRASSLVLGPLAARCGRARVSLPGGCAIGARPINLHLAGLEHLGAAIRQEAGYVEAQASGNGLRGATVHFDRITVTGTEDLMMAAVLAEGETVLENAAREPEVVDVAELLVKMGANIQGAGTSTIRIQGVSKLHGAEHRIIPDRIEAGTFMIAGAITRGDLQVTGCQPEHLTALLVKMRQAGVEIEEKSAGTVRVRGKSLRSVDVTTEEHPGFATDLQAQFMALMTQAAGISFVTETIFENRFMHVPELTRMGANIRIEGRQAIVAGPAPLLGAPVMASDLRASASLVLGALAAKGDTIIDRVYHIDRGYEKIEEKLAGAGAKILRKG
jgi:UDP-N-acetylglucosamine 1-carboxyvinyltransferase